MAIDRLSVLPDTLLVRILSFLFMKEAGRTCVLSKRWKYLWVELPRLGFFESLEINHESEKTRNFVSLVNRALDTRKWNYLEELRFKFMYYDCFASDVDAWIEFSVKNEVKRFSLMIFSSCWSDYYTPPQVLYSASCLTNLYLTKCIMITERKIEWQSLTTLILEDVELSQSLMDEIVSSCPVLSDLELEGCAGFNRLEANSRCLNQVKIEECEDEPYLEISAPYLCDLDITVYPERRKCQLKDISSVVTASINFFDFGGDFTEEVMSNVEEFLENFKHVKDLRVRLECFEVLSETALNGCQFPQSRVQHLTLSSCSEYEHSISGIIGLLESSPELETLVLDGYETEGDIVNLNPAAKSDLDGDLLHLKTIRVNNFADPKGEPLLTFARILLNRAPVLEEMMIAIDVEDTSDFVNIAQTLLTYPRSSTKAEIHLFSHKYPSILKL